MTNREKFRQVFGVDIEKFPIDEWDDQYGKRKEYTCTLEKMKHGFDIPKRTFSVYARNARQAREEAIQILGDEYGRYISGRPIYKLTVERRETKYEESQ